ncbi:hypothetical protein BGX20_002770, partial [Mortierella sp. AD010]
FSGAVSSIAMENDFGTLYLMTGSYDKSVRRWQVTKEGDEHKAILCWGSSHQVLTVCDLSFENVHGLVWSNRELLMQRGALTPTHPPSVIEEVSK